MNKLQRNLSALLILQLLLAAVVYWPRPAAAGGSGPLLDGLTASEVTSILIEDKDGGIAQLTRQGSEWLLASGGDYPAQSDKIQPLLEKLLAIQTSRLVARTSSSHQRLQVADDEFLRRVTLETAAGSSTLLVGSAPNPSATHVRLLGQDETYLTGEIASWDLNVAASGWIDTSYISLDRESISGITLDNASGTFTFRRAADGAWSMDGLAPEEQFDPTQFNTILSRLSSMSMSAPLGTTDDPAYALDTPRAAVTVAVEDQEQQSTKSYTLLVGAANSEDNSAYLKWSASDYYVEAPAYNFTLMVDATRDSFIQPPPTPEPGVEAAPAATPES